MLLPNRILNVLCGVTWAVCPTLVRAFDMSVDIQTSAPVAAVGSVVTLQASVSGDGTAPVWYRYRVRTPFSDEFRTVRDFSPSSTFDWAPIASEGLYEVEVSARDP